MRLYTKYIIKNLFSPLAIITLSLTAIVWLVRSMRFVEMIIDNGLPIQDFLYLSSLLLPFFLEIILPIAMFISILHIYIRLIGDRELIVLKTSGLSSLKLAKPALILATLTMIVGGIASFYIVPISYREFKDQQFLFRNTSTLSILHDKTFNTPSKGLTFYIESHDNDGILYGIIVYNQNQKYPMTLIAKKGKLITVNKSILLDIVSGRQEIDKGDGMIDVLYFDSYTMDLSSSSTSTREKGSDPEEYNIVELLFPKKNLAKDIRLRLQIEGHQKIIWQFLSISLTMIALITLLSGQFSRQLSWRKIISTCVIALIVVVIGITLKYLAFKYPILIILMYLNALAPVITGYYILKLNDQKNRY